MARVSHASSTLQGLAQGMSNNAMAALELACCWQERAGNEIDAAMDVLRYIRGDSTLTAKAVARRLRTYLVQVFLASVPAQKSPAGYLAWLSSWCSTMDLDERAQHLLAYSKWVPKAKKKRVRPARWRPSVAARSAQTRQYGSRPGSASRHRYRRVRQRS